MKRAATGDDGAFDVLVERHASPLLRLAAARLGDSVVATEVVQDALVRLFHALPTIRGDSSLRTWLVRVTLNLCTDAERRRRRSSRYLPLEAADGIADPRAGADEWESTDESARVKRVIATMPEAQRAPLLLRYEAGMSYAEIAKVLGLPIGTVGTRIAAGLKMLRTALTSHLAKP